MITKEQLRRVVYDSRNEATPIGTPRNYNHNLLHCKEVMVITGVRRCGKSVLLQQIRSQQTEKDYFISFDDERLLKFTTDDFQTLCDVWTEDFGEQHTYYLDEIQLIPGWERFVSRLHAQGNKVFVTGSNATMLSRELGTLLTGRHVTQELYPLSFAEFLNLKGIAIDNSDFYTTQGRAKLVNAENDYLVQGGMPQYITSGNSVILKEIFFNILIRDVLVRHKIPDEQPLRDVAYYLASNITHRFSYLGVAKAVGLKSSESVHDYINYMEEGYLVAQLLRYSNKVGVQLKSPKKIYFIDNAIASRVGFQLSDNKGSFLENAVYLQLRRKGADLYYYDEGKECDFVVKQGSHVTSVLQVSCSLANDKTRKREIDGLLAAMDDFALSEGTIVTLDESEEVQLTDGRKIQIVPFYRWALD